MAGELWVAFGGSITLTAGLQHHVRGVHWRLETLVRLRRSLERPVDEMPAELAGLAGELDEVG